MKKLTILWTSDNLDTAHNMVFMYATNSKSRGWIEEVDVIIWGASAKLTAENEGIQERIHLAQAAGVNVMACIACAQKLNVEEELKALNIDVKPLGLTLTEILEKGEKLITI